MELKYIILRGNFGTETPIVFNALISHKEVAAGREVTGAGFFSLVWDEEKRRFKATPYGESTTLKVGVGKDDEWFLNYFFNPN